MNNKIIEYANKAQSVLDKAKAVDFLAPLALRLYLVPIFWVAGRNKMQSFSDTAAWFGNPDWGLGLPMPTVMAFLATAAEVGGAVLLLLGLATRWACIPLLFTMFVAATQVHWHNGWQAVHDLRSPFPSVNAEAAIDRLNRAKSILREHGNYEWLTEHGNFIVSNNGVEWAVTYFVMLLALFFLGSGRYVSIDYWLKRSVHSRIT